ncbi:TPA: hypothetical protein SUN41_002041, partial [Streptococcus equi subsp. equi]|nr:hypothetical protein [Streptococcus equi subsp. equi]
SGTFVIRVALNLGLNFPTKKQLKEKTKSTKMNGNFKNEKIPINAKLYNSNASIFFKDNLEKKSLGNRLPKIFPKIIVVFRISKVCP